MRGKNALKYVPGLCVSLKQTSAVGMHTLGPSVDTSVHQVDRMRTQCGTSSGHCIPTSAHLQPLDGLRKSIINDPSI